MGVQKYTENGEMGGGDIFEITLICGRSLRRSGPPCAAVDRVRDPAVAWASRTVLEAMSSGRRTASDINGGGGTTFSRRGDGRRRAG